MGKYKEEKMHLPIDFVMPSEIPEVTQCANCRCANFDGSAEKHSILKYLSCAPLAKAAFKKLNMKTPNIAQIAVQNELQM